MADDDDPERRQWNRLRSLESALFERPPAHFAGRYRIEDVIGSGALGVVFRGHDDDNDRPVAIKVLRRNRHLRPGLMYRILRREAKTLSRLSHPHVVALLGVESLDTATLPNDVDGELGLVMEYVDGMTLDAWLATSERPSSEIVAVFIQAGQGLRAAHDAGVVHRDFKPGNVMMDGEGRARVLDFGLGRILEGDHPSTLATLRELFVGDGPSPVGTPLYMAPEVHAGTSGSPSSDQYSFCVALFAALAGRLPFFGTDIVELETAKLTEEPDFRGTRLRLSKPLQKALRRGLSVYPEDRHESMASLLETLGRTPEGGGSWNPLRGLFG